MKPSPPRLELQLPPLDIATVAWLFDVCGQLSHALLQDYGDELEAYWTATGPDQPSVAPLAPPPARRPR